VTRSPFVFVLRSCGFPQEETKTAGDNTDPHALGSNKRRLGKIPLWPTLPFFNVSPFQNQKIVEKDIDPHARGFSHRRLTWPTWHMPHHPRLRGWSLKLRCGSPDRTTGVSRSIFVPHYYIVMWVMYWPWLVHYNFSSSLPWIDRYIRLRCGPSRIDLCEHNNLTHIIPSTAHLLNVREIIRTHKSLEQCALPRQHFSLF